MNNPTYEQRVEAIAKEMAREDGNKIDKVPGEELYILNGIVVYDIDVPLWLKTNGWVAIAHIAVKHMANAAEDAYLAVEDGHCMGAGTYVREQGLIPDTDQQQLSILKPGEPGSGGYDPNNPPPDQEAANDGNI
jgi:hypothetical protein